MAKPRHQPRRTADKLKRYPCAECGATVLLTDRVARHIRAQTQSRVLCELCRAKETADGR